MATGKKTSGTRAGQAARQARLAALRAEQERRERARKVRFAVGSGVLVAVLVAGLVWLGVSKSKSSSNTAAANAPAGALAPVWGGLTGQSVDGVSANTSEQLAYHVHAHLAIYINGTQKYLPWGIGIAQPWQSQQTADGGTFVQGGSAFYYLHTHDSSGVIHIESPTQTTYTLGQFFAEWNQPLSATQIGPATGSVTAYVNGAPYTGDPAGIKLTAHQVIQLDLGQSVAPAPYTFANGL